MTNNSNNDTTTTTTNNNNNNNIDINININIDNNSQPDRLICGVSAASFLLFAVLSLVDGFQAGQATIGIFRGPLSGAPSLQACISLFGLIYVSIWLNNAK